MIASVLHLYNVVEGSADSLTIRLHPPPEPETAIQFDPLPDRLWTYAVRVGSPQVPTLVGFVRWDPADVWIARSLGSDRVAATIRRYADRFKAVTWLQKRHREGR
jgi:hypothetical protein